MRKVTIILVIILCCLSLYAILNLAPYGHTIEELVYSNQGASQLPFKKGESFTYEVKCKDFKIGKSILTFNGEGDLDNKKVYHITFLTILPTLRDTEEIYADKNTFLPIEVHRKIRKRIGFSDNIIEKYDQENFRVDIEQKSKLRTNSFSIEKESPIHNVILLSYYYRTFENFNTKDRFKINLPTVDFEVAFKGIETIETHLGDYRAYAFTSDPPEFELWLSADEERIPLKIKNPGTLGYSLVIKSID